MRNLVFLVLLVLIFIVPWETLVHVVESQTLARYVGYVAALLAVICIVMKMSLMHLSLPFIFLFLFWLFSSLSIFWSVDPEVSMIVLPTNFSMMVFAWLVVEFVESYKQQRWALRAYLFGSAVPLSMLYYVFITSGAHIGTRFSAAGHNANYLSSVILFSIPMAVYIGVMFQQPASVYYSLDRGLPP
jgi:hypothetical protein